MAKPEIDNFKLMKEIPTWNMNKGADVPLDLIMQLNPPEKSGLCLDMGAGSMKKTKTLWKEGYAISPFDILEDYEEFAKKNGLFGAEMDASVFSIPDSDDQLLGKLEMYQMVLMEGLLVNMVDKDGMPSWERGIKVAEMFLNPGGWMFGAVVIRQDTKSDEFRDLFTDQDKFINRADRWKERYNQNQSITKFPRGSILIGKPGLQKNLEWGNSDDLKTLMDTNLERIVHHIDLSELTTVLKNIDFSELSLTPSVFPSRVPGEFYLGVVFALKKSNKYMFNPWYKGLSKYSKEHTDRRVWKKWFGGLQCRPSYFPVCFTLLAQNLPDQSYAPWVIEIRDRSVEEFKNLMKDEDVIEDYGKEGIEILEGEVNAAIKGEKEFYKYINK